MNKFLSKVFNASSQNHSENIKEVSTDSEFVFSKQVNALLSDELSKSICWRTPDHPTVPVGDLYKIWSKFPGANKWHHYFSIYEKLFSDLKQEPIKILEIGVYNGASLKMWNEYFHKDSLIVGIDIDEHCKNFDKVEHNIHVRIGDQSNQSFLESVIAEFGDFDIIIDDGSHIVSHMIASFNYLYVSGLKNSGIYLVEDTHSNYWSSYRDQKISFVDFTKHLIDLLHFHYTVSNDDVEAFRLGADTRKHSIVVPQITVLIDEIRVFDSIIAFIKPQNKSLPLSEHL